MAEGGIYDEKVAEESLGWLGIRSPRFVSNNISISAVDHDRT